MDGESRRDAGIEQVLANAGKWSHRARDLILDDDSLTGQSMTGEDIRFFVKERIGEPHHHNAWGGLIMGLVKRKRLVLVEWVKMRDPRSHARMTPRYEVVAVVEDDS